MLLLVEKVIRVGICQSINRYVKANNKYMKDFDINKESSYLVYCDVKNLYVWIVSQKVPVNDFKWVEDILNIWESFLKSCNDKSNEGFFLKVDVQYPKKLYDLLNDLPILPEKIKIEKSENVIANLHDKAGYVIT